MHAKFEWENSFKNLYSAFNEYFPKYERTA